MYLEESSTVRDFPRDKGDWTQKGEHYVAFGAQGHCSARK